MTDLFAQIILDEAKHPANFGQLTGDHLKKTKFNPSCGDVVQITLKLNEKTKIIEDLKWTGEGCSISMAAISLLSQKIIGKTTNYVLNLDHKFMLKLLDLEEITPGRLKCLLIGLTAIQDLLKN